MGEPTVTINESPSAQIIAPALTEFTVTDAKGRTLKLKKPVALAQYRMIEAMGDSASIQAYFAMAMPLIYLVSIDGDAVYTPNRKSELEALIQRLDTDGIDAIMQGIQDNFITPDPEEDKKTLKK